jgi:hypothetical protein
LFYDECITLIGRSSTGEHFIPHSRRFTTAWKLPQLQLEVQLRGNVARDSNTGQPTTTQPRSKQASPANKGPRTPIRSTGNNAPAQWTGGVSSKHQSVNLLAQPAAKEQATALGKKRGPKHGARDSWVKDWLGESEAVHAQNLYNAHVAPLPGVPLCLRYCRYRQCGRRFNLS